MGGGEPFLGVEVSYLTTQNFQGSSSTATSSFGEELEGDDIGVRSGSGEGGNTRMGKVMSVAERMAHDTATSQPRSQTSRSSVNSNDGSRTAVHQEELNKEFEETIFIHIELLPNGGAKARQRKSKDILPLHWPTGLLAIESGLATSATASSAGSSRVPSSLLDSTAKSEVAAAGGRRQMEYIVDHGEHRGK